MLNTLAVNDNQSITKAYVDQFNQEIERSRRDLGIDFFNESSDLVKNNQENEIINNTLINLDGVGVKGNPLSDNELVNEKHLED